MWKYAILGVLIGYFSRFLLIVIRDKAEDRRNDKDGNL